MTDSPSLDTSFARLLRLAAARNLPGVERSTSYRTPALAVGGVAFVRLLDPTTAVLQCPVDQKVLLMEISPHIYFETEHYVGYDAMLIDLEKIGDEELSLRLHDAWVFKAPESLKKSID